MAGTVMALAVQLLLVIFGSAVGLSVLAASADATAKGISTGAAIWVIAATIISMFCGAFVTARLAGMLRRAEGMLHGAITWGLAALVGIVALSSLLSGTWNVFASTANTVMASGAQRAPTTGAAWGMFVMLLLGLCASILGGAYGAKAMREERAVGGTETGTDTGKRPGLAA